MSGKEVNVSVVIPAFNRGQTIFRCLESVINQTYSAMEILVVDDGSTDNTRDIVTNFPSDKVVLLCQQHKGAQAARNRGIINARGEYIAFLDSDDEWMPQMLEETVHCLLENGHGYVVYSDCYVQKENRKVLWQLPDCEGNAYAALLKKPGPTISFLVKKQLLWDIGRLDEKVAAYQEWDTAIRLAQKAKFVHIHKPLYIYNLHGGETISKNSRKDVSGYGYIVGKHRKSIINVCGYEVLLEHYKLLIKKCIQNKDKRLYMYIWKWYKTKLMVGIRGRKI